MTIKLMLFLDLNVVNLIKKLRFYMVECYINH
jgi:hypothetical protein